MLVGGLAASVVGLGCVCASSNTPHYKNYFVILSFLRKKQQKHEEFFYGTLTAKPGERRRKVKLTDENSLTKCSASHYNVKYLSLDENCTSIQLYRLALV